MNLKLYAKESIILRSLYNLTFIVVTLFALTEIISSRAGADELKLTTGEYPPFTSEHIPGGGVVSEIVELVIMEMGHDFVVDYLPWKRGYILSKKGKYAATYPYLLTEEREDEFLYSAPIIEWESKVYVRRDSGIEYHSSLDLLGLRECLPHHYGGLPELDKLHAAGSIKRVSTPYIKSCWLMILNGRADFFVEDVFVADIFRREVLAERSDEVVELQKTISTDYGHIIFPKGFDQSEELVAGFNDTLAKVAERGEIARIKESFLKQHTQLVDLIN
ncbi:substrate-binding periplasmic protein [Kiloniella sp.]|uniref:substrate-binding periplasmic protein n=1 Tax=Kiloniella sp. TaxID=1938587 RepID=UPI003A92F3FC